MAPNASDKPQNIFIKDRQRQLLFANWMQKLVEERLGPLTGWEGDPNSDTWGFRLAEHRMIRLEIKKPRFRVKVTQPAKDKAAVREIVDEAWQLTQASDTGPGVWYKTQFSSQVNALSPLGQLHFMRFLNEHGNRRVKGPIRFTNSVLLEFTQKQDEQDSLPAPAPDFTVDVTLLAPGPGQGPFAQLSSINVATIIRAVLAYSTAAPITHSGLILAFPAKQEDIDAAQRHLTDPAVGELMVDGVILAPRFNEFTSSPQQAINLELFRRVQGALYSYAQALHQENEYIALILLVTAIEALSVPNAKWSHERLVARFIDFVLQLAPGEIKEIISHGNFGQAFGTYTSPKRFLDDVYDRRSKPLHTGYVPHSVLGPMPGLGGDSGIRVTLVSELFRKCMTSFLNAPFSSLTGHPECDPKAQTSNPVL